MTKSGVVPLKAIVMHIRRCRMSDPEPEDKEYTVENAAEDTGVSIEEATAAWVYAAEGDDS